MLISDFLLTGEQNAQTAKEICNHAKALAVASLSHWATTAEAHAASTSIYTDTDLHRRRRKPIIPQGVQEPMTRTKATADPQKPPLSLDAAAAARMGLSYGKYKTIQYDRWRRDNAELEAARMKRRAAKEQAWERELDRRRKERNG